MGALSLQSYRVIDELNATKAGCRAPGTFAECLHLAPGWNFCYPQELSPAYDLLNSTIPNPRSREELALPLRGKKSNLRENDFWRYLAGERLGLTAALIEQTRARFAAACAGWPAWIDASILSAEMKTRYLTLLAERRKRLGGI